MQELTEENEVEPDESEDMPAETKVEDSSTQELIKLLQERLTLYETAEQKAKKENESGKARRYNRGVRTLKEMLASAKTGRSISEADIPPPLPSSATTESVVVNTGNCIAYT